ncbi:MAG: serine hydrolase [Saprospiraceae bacterium]|nr:serine hydrolase [Saprospiraceae bacterium]
MNTFPILLRSILFTAVLWLTTAAGLAQTDEQIAGLWQGAIDVPGMKLELSVAFNRKDGAWAGSMNIPVQNLRDMALDELRIEGGAVEFKLSKVPGNASFSGRFENEFTEIRGDFRQSGMNLPMYLVKESAAQSAAEAARLAVALERFRVLADSLRQLRSVPGLAVGIYKDGKVIFSEGFGFRDQEAQLPVTPATLFAIGSSTKAFTAVGLAMLVEDGKLEWDKPVINYLPDFKLMDDFATREMTAVDLLTHQSGLPRHDLMWYGSGFSRMEIFERLRHLESNKSFRSAWQYQNLMYLTAGILAERISGQSWEDFTRERIFNPLGMEHSFFAHKNVPKELPLAQPYRKTEKEEVLLMPHRDIYAIGPAGSIYSNVEDMLQWVQFHLHSGKVGDKQVLPVTAVQKLHSPHKVIENSTSPAMPELSNSSYGLGWFAMRNKDLDVVHHGGNIDGFSALVYLLPGKNTGMVFLTNLNGNPLPGLLARYATDLLFDREPIDWYARAFGDGNAETPEKEDAKPTPGTKPSRALKEFAGRYEHPGYGIVELKMEKDSLQFAFNTFRGKLRHWHYDVFQVRFEEFGQDMFVTFYSGKDGVVNRLGVPLEGALDEDIHFAKLPPDLLSNAAYVASIIGQYEADAFSVSIEMKQDKLYSVIVGQPELELIPIKENWFSIKGLNGFSVEFVFEKDKSKAATVKFHQPNGVFPAKRKG